MLRTSSVDTVNKSASRKAAREFNICNVKPNSLQFPSLSLFFFFFLLTNPYRSTRPRDCGFAPLNVCWSLAGLLLQKWNFGYFMILGYEMLTFYGFFVNPELIIHLLFLSNHATGFRSNAGSRRKIFRRVSLKKIGGKMPQPSLMKPQEDHSSRLQQQISNLLALRPQPII